MKRSICSSQRGRVASLHLHPREPGEHFQTVSAIDVETQKGIAGNPRYFARRSRSGGLSKRQVSLIGREQIAEHAATLGLETIPPGTIRSNIETSGIDLCSLLGKKFRLATQFSFFTKRGPVAPKWMRFVLAFPKCRRIIASAFWRR